MKKQYMAPSITVYSMEAENLMYAGSTGNYGDPGDSDAKSGDNWQTPIQENSADAISVDAKAHKSLWDD